LRGCGIQPIKRTEEDLPRELKRAAGLDHTSDLLQLVADIRVGKCDRHLGPVVQGTADAYRLTMDLIRRMYDVLRLFDIKLRFECREPCIVPRRTVVTGEGEYAAQRCGSGAA